MENERLEEIVEALAGEHVLSYALKADGVLVVIDQQGRKHTYLPAAYRHLQRKPAKFAKKTAGGENEQPQ